MAKRIGVGAAVLAATVAAWLPSTAAAATCDVTNGAELTTALADVNCDPINLAAGNYTSATSPAFTIDRDVTLNGAGAATTTVTRSGAGHIFTVGASASPATLNGLTISGATDGSGFNVTGAAAQLNISDSVVSDNTVGGAGGAGIGSSSTSATALVMTDSIVRGNDETGFQGGGIRNGGSGTMSFNRVLFEDNSSTGAGGGGAISNGSTGTVTVTNSTFFGNRANNDGGALRAGSAGGTMNLNNITVSGNTADDDNAGGGNGGGIFNGSASTLTIRNSIVADNVDKGNQAPDCAAGGGAVFLTRLGHELIKSTTGCTFGGAGDTTTGFLTGIDPMLGALAPNGGFSDTMALLPGSPAIGAGNPATPGSGGNACDALDQRGFSRLGSPEPCDLGAFEVQPVPAAEITPPPAAPAAPFATTGLRAKALKKCKKIKDKPKRKKCKRKARRLPV